VAPLPRLKKERGPPLGPPPPPPPPPQRRGAHPPVPFAFAFWLSWLLGCCHQYYCQYPLPLPQQPELHSLRLRYYQTSFLVFRSDLLSVAQYTGKKIPPPPPAPLPLLLVC
jgi:hypothetical protein